MTEPLSSFNQPGSKTILCKWSRRRDTILRWGLHCLFNWLITITAGYSFWSSKLSEKDIFTWSHMRLGSVFDPPVFSPNIWCLKLKFRPRETISFTYFTGSKRIPRGLSLIPKLGHRTFRHVTAITTWYNSFRQLIHILSKAKRHKFVETKLKYSFKFKKIVLVPSPFFANFPNS